MKEGAGGEREFDRINGGTEEVERRKDDWDQFTEEGGEAAMIASHEGGRNRW